MANHDYKNEKVRGVFLPLLLGTLLFLESRMNLTRGSHRGVSYLFQESPLPSERDLQEDYFIFMHSNLRGITVERSDVAGGRADVLFESKGIRTASELKKEEISCSFEDIENCYAAQGVEYQNTNIRLGILLVLDLTLKNSGVGHITSQVCQRQLKTDPLFVSVGN